MGRCVWGWGVGVGVGVGVPIRNHKRAHTYEIKYLGDSGSWESMICFYVIYFFFYQAR